MCARAVEKTDACFASQCHVLRRKCSFVNHLVLYLEENTKRAAGLSLAVQFLPEKPAVAKHKLKSRIHEGAIAIRATANERTDRNKVIMSMHTGMLISPYPDQEGNKLQRPNPNFCKPIKNNSEGCPSNQVPRQQ